MSVITAAPPAAARGSALGRLTISELKLFLRERTRLLFGVGFPLILLIIFGSIPSFNRPYNTFGGQTVLDVYIPVLIAFSLALLSLTALPMALASYREKGVLKRLQTTPAGAARVLGAQLLVNLSVALFTVILILAIARLAYGVALPRQLGGFIVAAVLTAAALMAVGLLIAALAPNGRAAQITGALLFYPMMFFAGLWLPLAEMPSALRHFSHATPLGAATQALQDASVGHWPHPLQLVTLAAYVVVFGLAAAKLFRWE